MDSKRVRINRANDQKWAIRISSCESLLMWHIWSNKLYCINASVNCILYQCIIKLYIQSILLLLLQVFACSLVKYQNTAVGTNISNNDAVFKKIPEGNTPIRSLILGREKFVFDLRKYTETLVRHFYHFDQGAAAPKYPV